MPCALAHRALWTIHVIHVIPHRAARAASHDPTSMSVVVISGLVVATAHTRLHPGFLVAGALAWLGRPRLRRKLCVCVCRSIVMP